MTKRIFTAVVSVFLILNQSALAQQRNPTVAYYTAPEMRLVEVDKQIINQLSAGSTVNFAAYVLSDHEILDALRFAAMRGVKIRIYLDAREIAQLHLNENHPLVKLWRTPGVEIKVKAETEGLMHLKAYSVDNSMLRTGSANDSYSGLLKQDNDLLLITDKNVVEAFNRKFQEMWTRRSNVPFSYP